MSTSCSGELKETEKWTNKGKNKSKEFDSQSHNTTTHFPCVYSLNILALKVPEKTLTQIFNVNL